MFEAYLLVITGKKNAIAREQFTIIDDIQNKTNSVITDLQNQLSVSTDEINKHRQIHDTFVHTVQTYNDNTENKITT